MPSTVSWQQVPLMFKRAIELDPSYAQAHSLQPLPQFQTLLARLG